MNSGRLTLPFHKFSCSDTEWCAASNQEGPEGSGKLASDTLCLGRNAWKAALSWNCRSEDVPEASPTFQSTSYMAAQRSLRQGSLIGSWRNSYVLALNIPKCHCGCIWMMKLRRPSQIQGNQSLPVNGGVRNNRWPSLPFHSITPLFLVFASAPNPSPNPPHPFLGEQVIKAGLPNHSREIPTSQLSYLVLNYQNLAYSLWSYKAKFCFTAFMHWAINLGHFSRLRFLIRYWNYILYSHWIWSYSTLRFKSILFILCFLMLVCEFANPHFVMWIPLTPFQYRHYWRRLKGNRRKEETLLFACGFC